jgi:hypothetical protein
MPAMPPATAILDLIDRIENLAILAAWLRPEVRTAEESMFMELVRLRALEAGAMLANRPKPIRPSSIPEAM